VNVAIALVAHKYRNRRAPKHMTAFTAEHDLWVHPDELDLLDLLQNWQRIEGSANGFASSFRSHERYLADPLARSLIGV
jgi:hypothetical protein